MSGNAAYVIGTLCDLDIGRKRILEMVVTAQEDSHNLLSNLTAMLKFDDQESIMNAAGTIGTLVSVESVLVSLDLNNFICCFEQNLICTSNRMVWRTMYRLIFLVRF